MRPIMIQKREREKNACLAVRYSRPRRPRQVSGDVLKEDGNWRRRRVGVANQRSLLTIAAAAIGRVYTFRVAGRPVFETNEISDSLCCAGVAAGARRRFLFITIQFFFSQVRTAHNTSGTHAYTQTVIIPVAILCRARLNK